MFHPLLSWTDASSVRPPPLPPRGHRAAAKALLDLRSKDPATFRHVRDTARLTVAIARDLGLCSDDRGHLAHCALMHDLGKLFVDPWLLRSTDRLGDDALDEIRSHPLRGYRYARKKPELRAVADAIRHHHERWDGHGYPDGLVGSDTPWDARVVAVADAAEAMLAGRSYRPPRSPADTLAELRRCSGSQFDPWIARAAYDGTWTRRVLLELGAEGAAEHRRHAPGGIGDRTGGY